MTVSPAGIEAQMPAIETPGNRVLGTPVPNARKRASLITVEEIAAIVARLRSYWSATRAQQPYPLRARYIVAWETALRPRTIGRLAAPGAFHRGATALHHDCTMLRFCTTNASGVVYAGFRFGTSPSGSAVTSNRRFRRYWHGSCGC